jgi:hypothetical protein
MASMGGALKGCQMVGSTLGGMHVGFKIISVVDVIYIYPMRLQVEARHSMKMMTLMLPINEGTRSKITSQYKKVLFSFDE